MYRCRKIILLLLLLSIIVPLQNVQAQEDSTEKETYETYKSQDNYGTAIDDGTVTEEDDSTVTEDDAEKEEAYVPAFTKTEAFPSQKARSVPATQWQKLTRDKAFQYEEEPEEKEPASNSAWLNFFMAIFEFLTSTGGKILLAIIVAILVIWIVVRIFQLKGNIFFAKKDKKLGNGIVDELSDQYIPDNWEQAIQNAVNSGNYRLAVRHGYRYLLHLLQEKELIHFQTAKTNYQYAYELSGTRLHKPFLQLTRNYEYAWYGGFDIDRERFESYYHVITGIKNELN